LGFFEVSGVSERRIFVKANELDPRFPWPDDPYPCFPTQTVTIGTADSLDYYIRGKGYELTSAAYLEFGFSATLAPKYCTDCRFRGPTIQPDFWIY
jgi:hypothetical protein